MNKKRPFLIFREEVIDDEKKVSWLFLFLFGISLIPVTHAHATESEFKVSIDTILPENQVTPNVKYFDLKMKPSDEQKIVVRLTNHTSEEMNLKVTYNEAKTTSQGIIEYSKNKELKMNSPSDILFTNIIEGPEKVSLKPNEVKDINFTLKVPEREFDGFILGGIEFIEEVETSNDNSALKTQRSYLVGVKLRETDKKLPIELELNQTIVGTKNYKNAILISLSNQNANFIEGISIHGTITKKGDSTILVENNISQARIAPYSTIETPVYLDQMLLDPGKYELKLTVKDQKKIVEEWNQEFKVTKKEAELLKSNQDPFEEYKDYNLLWLIILLFIVGLGIFLIWLNKDKFLKNKKGKGKKNDKK